MRPLKVWLLLSAMIFSLSIPTGFYASAQNVQTAVELPFSHDSTKSIDKQISDLLLFDKEAPRTNNHRSVQFLTEVQSEPEFEIVFEPPLTKDAQAPPKPVSCRILPWYLQSSLGKSRVSGWKDGNSLYTGKITYHS